MSSSTVPGAAAAGSTSYGFDSMICSRRESYPVVAPGHGVTARCRFHTVTASAPKSTIPSRLASFFAYEPACGCFVRGACSRAASATLSARSGAPSSARRSASVPAVSSEWIGAQRCRM